jgi:uncharacterized membrane protein
MESVCNLGGVEESLGHDADLTEAPLRKSPPAADTDRMEAITGITAIFVLMGLPILITWRMGEKKGRNGIWWGILLGWVGVVLLALNLPPKREKRATERTVA